MSGKRARVFSREFKQAAVLRMLAGETTVQVLAAELQIWPKLLYDWRRHYEEGGPAALRLTRRPRTADAAEAPERTRPPISTRRRRRRGRPRAVVDPGAERIAELERKVGQQAVELDFFKRALRHIKAARPANAGRGASASSRSSTR